MHFRNTLTALVAMTLCTAFVAVAHADNATALATPSCFVGCAASAATDVGCSGPADAACYCTKEDFIKANARCTMASCPDLAMNLTLTAASFKSLENICKKATGGKFDLTIPTAADMGMSGDATATASSNGAIKATTSTSTSAAPSLQPPMAHIMSACLVLSALVAGSSLLL